MLYSLKSIHRFKTITVTILNHLFLLKIAVKVSAVKNKNTITRKTLSDKKVIESSIYLQIIVGDGWRTPWGTFQFYFMLIVTQLCFSYFSKIIFLLILYQLHYHGQPKGAGPGGSPNMYATKKTKSAISSPVLPSTSASSKHGGACPIGEANI